MPDEFEYPDLYVLRHGRSLANEAGLIVSDPVQGGSGYGLSERGAEQVRESVTAFRAGGDFRPGGRIYTSPFLRARETAEIAASVLQWPVEPPVDCLRERFFGQWDGTADRGYQAVWDRDALDPGHRQGGAESVLDVWARLSPFLEGLAGVGTPVLLVTHGDVASVLVCGIHGRNFKEHRRGRTLGTGQLIRVRDG